MSISLSQPGMQNIWSFGLWPEIYLHQGGQNKHQFEPQVNWCQTSSSNLCSQRFVKVRSPETSRLIKLAYACVTVCDPLIWFRGSPLQIGISHQILLWQRLWLQFVLQAELLQFQLHLLQHELKDLPLLAAFPASSAPNRLSKIPVLQWDFMKP